MQPTNLALILLGGNMAKKKKKASDEILRVPVPDHMWEEMLKRAGGDANLAGWIWSCWVHNGLADGSKS